MTLNSGHYRMEEEGERGGKGVSERERQETQTIPPHFIHGNTRCNADNGHALNNDSRKYNSARLI